MLTNRDLIEQLTILPKRVIKSLPRKHRFNIFECDLDRAGTVIDKNLTPKSVMTFKGILAQQRRFIKMVQERQQQANLIDMRKQEE